MKICPLSAPAGSRDHHIGLAALTDILVMDIATRILNLQIGFGEPVITPSFTPWDHRSTGDLGNLKIASWGDSDLASMVTLNQSVNFHDLRELRADTWCLMQGSTSVAYGGRVLVSSRIWSSTGVLVASCTCEVSFPSALRV